jgi:hypothetical protein
MENKINIENISIEEIHILNILVLLKSKAISTEEAINKILKLKQ